eukprot:c23014_g1_i3 orf=257-2164(+)
MGMEDCQSLDERTGWGFMWTSSEWRRQFLVLSPGAFKAFSCNQRSSVEKMISLARCVVGFHKPFASPESKTSKYPPKKRIWKNLLKLVLSDHAFSQADIAVITVKPRRGKTCFLMFPSQAEAEVWKFGIEEAVALANADVEKKDLKKSSRRSKAVQQASDAIDQTRMFFQTKSLLKPPFGLRWEAYSPLFRVREARQTPSSSTHTMEREKVEPISSKPTEPLWHDLATLQGCTAFLCSSYLNVRALEHAALMVDHFKGSYQMGDSSLPDELRLEAWKGTAHRIVKALVDGVLLSNPSLEPCLANDELMDQLWSASEVWVFGAVHDKIMGACKQMFAMQDVSTNNILAKLEKVDPAKLGVRAEFEVLVLGEAMDEFRLLNHLRTPYEKAMCLRKTVMCIIDGIQRLIKSCTGALKDTEGLLPCTDDLLSFMLLLMARAKVRNLHANACYMENFINLQKDTSRGELVYHITNFVAACKYLHSEAVQELLANVSLLPKTAVSQMQVVSGDSRSSSPSFCRRSSSFEGSSGTHITASSSRVDSLESEANVTRWEEICDKSSCFDPDAFSNWRGSDSLNGRHFSEFESMKNPFSPNRDWYIDREDSLGDDRPNSFRSGCGKRVLALPGDSPGFLLAPTYH